MNKSNFQILFIRHGESMNNTLLLKERELYLAQRSADPTLSKKGIQQSALCAQHLIKRKYNITRMMGSPLIRAMETMWIFKNHLDLFNPDIKYEIVNNFYEAGGLREKEDSNQCKIFCGQKRSWYESTYHGIHICPEVTNEGWYFLGRKETQEESRKRAIEFLKALKKEIKEYTPPTNNEVWVYIIHGDFFDLLLGHQLKRQQSASRQQIYYAMENTGITCFQVDDMKKLHIRSFNNYEHIMDYPELVSDWHAIMNNILYRQIIDDKIQRQKQEHQSPFNLSSPTEESQKQIDQILDQQAQKKVKKEEILTQSSQSLQ